MFAGYALEDESVISAYQSTYGTAVSQEERYMNILFNIIWIIILFFAITGRLGWWPLIFMGGGSSGGFKGGNFGSGGFGGFSGGGFGGGGSGGSW